MDLLTNPVSRVLRNALRKLGLTAFVKRHVVSLWAPDALTEERFGRMLVESVRSGDTVWDVGANVGFYTKQLLERVGPSGIVCAFEPGPDNLGPLRAALTGHENGHVFARALGDHTGEIAFAISGTTGHIVEGADSLNSVRVALCTGDSVVAENPGLTPCVVKIDTEGAEFAVLSGLKATLADRRLRAIFIEVHFSVLEKSGRGDHPKLIINLLQGMGFTTRWIDASHLHATRE